MTDSSRHRSESASRLPLRIPETDKEPEGPLLSNASSSSFSSPALAVTTIQTSRTAIHDHHRFRGALVAHGGARREARAIAGDFDHLFGVGVGAGGGGHA